MGATLWYLQEVVAEEVVCDECGYENGEVDYSYYSSEHEEGQEWTCPECGVTSKLTSDWRDR